MKNDMIQPSKKAMDEVKKLKEWEVNGRELTRGFYLKGFNDALSFINDVGKVANKLEHHPDILLSEFSTVRLFIKTNEFGRITTMDTHFAGEVDKLWNKKYKSRAKKIW